MSTIMTDSGMPNRWGDKPYYSLDYYLKTHFGEKVYRLSLNAGLTCPNRDGTLGSRGCIFCSQGGSGDFAVPPSESVTAQIEHAKERIAKKSNCRKFIAYFQAYTNTYGPISYLRRIFLEAIHHPDIVALSIATRPDCLSDEVLELLSELNQIKPVWIELGLQTIWEDTRRFLRSGFSLPCFLEAISRLKRQGLTIIVHIILGLPGETKAQMLETAEYLAHLPINGIKLQLLHILTDTDLYKYYLAHPFPLLNLEEYCDLLCQCIERLPPDMVIHRLTGDGPKSLLYAPAFSSNKKLVLNRIHQTFAAHNSYQGKQFKEQKYYLEEYHGRSLNTI